VEFAGIGPAPFCAMMLADFGADVVRIDRANTGDLGIPVDPVRDVLNRGKRSIVLDLKSPDDRDCALELVARADAVVEGFRPSVMERLGLGPDACLALNPKLVYGRITGWGQEGPLAQAAGHDINYIAIAGALGCIGLPGAAPVAPLNLIGDFGGGGVYLALGIACALIEARSSGRGQVVDAAMLDGAASLMTFLYGMLADKNWSETRGDNLIDGGAPWYGSYRTRDGEYIAVGAIEERFYRAFVAGLGLEFDALAPRSDKSRWPELRAEFTARIVERDREEWVRLFEGVDACVSPVLGLQEVFEHPHVTSRNTFVEEFGMRQPAPAPRFSRTPAAIHGTPPRPGAHTEEILAELARERSTSA
jgi:alpha-methylacyl-CoA racemase